MRSTICEPAWKVETKSLISLANAIASPQSAEEIPRLFIFTVDELIGIEARIEILDRPAFFSELRHVLLIVISRDAAHIGRSNVHHILACRSIVERCRILL